MMRLLEPVLFGGVALAGHLVLFGLAGGVVSGPPAATGPEGAVTLAAAPPDLAALVATWDDAPEITSAVPDLPAPAAPDLPQPAAIRADQAAPRADLPRINPAVADIAPQVDTAPPPPVPAAAPKPATPPPARPTAQAKAKPKPPSAGSPQAPRQAAGPAATAPSQDGTAALVARWGKGIIAALARQSVRGRDMPKGTVTLALQIDTAGRLVAARVARSSGHGALDAAALAAVARARFPAAPRGLPAGPHAFSVPIASR